MKVEAGKREIRSGPMLRRRQRINWFDLRRVFVKWFIDESLGLDSDSVVQDAAWTTSGHHCFKLDQDLCLRLGRTAFAEHDAVHQMDGISQ
jgi:hypothetical protein